MLDLGLSGTGSEEFALATSWVWELMEASMLVSCNSMVDMSCQIHQVPAVRVSYDRETQLILLKLRPAEEDGGRIARLGTLIHHE